METILCKDFQKEVEEVLLRHNSILDVISKLEESSSRVNRSVVKAITSCGCININSVKVTIPEDAEYHEIKKYKSTHLTGELCPVCKEKVETEIGNHLFYLAAIANHMGVSLDDSLKNEYNRVKTLGHFSLY